MKSTALITGGDGFVGKHLSSEIEDDFNIFLVDRNLPKSNDTHVECNITNKRAITRVIKDISPDIIFHLASVTPATSTSTIQFYKTNVLGTLNLLEAVRIHSPSSMVLLITSSAMFGPGNITRAAIDENSPLSPANAYGSSKAMQHLLGYQYAVQHNLNIIRICPFNLIGPGLPRGFVASDFAYQLASILSGAQDPKIVVGNLNAYRDFLDVRDAVRAINKIVNYNKTGGTYNLGSGKPTKIQELLEILIAQTGLSISIIQQGKDSENELVPFQVCNNSKLRNVIDWQPSISLPQSLKEILEFWSEQLSRE